MKEANGEILWIDEYCVGYKCECGNDDLIINTDSYFDEDDINKCSKCKKVYKLVQTNIVYELGLKEEK